MGGNSLTAGFPFPILHDDNAGSPVDGWGTIGGEDFISLDIGAFFLNAFFYGLIILILFVIAKSIFESVKRSIQ
ncbi:MAG: hypothetical protein V7K98_23355 [Nostoc sp.]|uniref:hypothetical protein n=1 Tax=Nostoc sp. TaxID=1180 RepID=UPI002FF5F5F9